MSGEVFGYFAARTDQSGGMKSSHEVAVHGVFAEGESTVTHST